MIRRIICLLNGIMIGISVVSYVKTSDDHFAVIGLLSFCVAVLYLMGDD